jgi:hypothetical protein
MLGNQALYRPNEPGFQAPGRLSSLPMRTMCRAKYPSEFRSTCIRWIASLNYEIQSGPISVPDRLRRYRVGVFWTRFEIVLEDSNKFENRTGLKRG